VFRKYDVIHYCVPNIASRVSRTASFSISNILAPVLLNIAEKGGIDELLYLNKNVRQGLYLYKGNLTNRSIGEWFDLAYTEGDLLF